MTKAYIGTKIVGAYPFVNVDGDDGYSVVYADGYESWCPKETFEQSYRALSEEEGNLVTRYGAEPK